MGMFSKVSLNFLNSTRHAFLLTAVLLLCQLFCKTVIPSRRVLSTVINTIVPFCLLAFFALEMASKLVIRHICISIKLIISFKSNDSFQQIHLKICLAIANQFLNTKTNTFEEQKRKTSIQQT